MEENEVIREEHGIKVEGNRVLSKTFLWMFLGLLVSGIAAWYTFSSNLFTYIYMGNLFNTLLIVEIVVVIIFSLLFKKLPASVVAILYFAYAIINGITLSVIFAVFVLDSILYCFIVAALAFGGMALFGYKTSVDMHKFAPMLFGFLIAGIVMSVVNIFVGNDMLEIVISWVVLLVFFGITAYDIQKIKNMQYFGDVPENKIHIYGAMQIYLDFINIFLRVLSIFGKRR